MKHNVQRSEFFRGFASTSGDVFYKPHDMRLLRVNASPSPSILTSLPRTTRRQRAGSTPIPEGNVASPPDGRDLDREGELLCWTPIAVQQADVLCPLGVSASNMSTVDRVLGEYLSFDVAPAPIAPLMRWGTVIRPQGKDLQFLVVSSDHAAYRRLHAYRTPRQVASVLEVRIPRSADYRRWDRTGAETTYFDGNTETTAKAFFETLNTIDLCEGAWERDPKFIGTPLQPAGLPLSFVQLVVSDLRCYLGVAASQK
jgi:hypothetical protein